VLVGAGADVGVAVVLVTRTDLEGVEGGIGGRGADGGDLRGHRLGFHPNIPISGSRRRWRGSRTGSRFVLRSCVGRRVCLIVRVAWGLRR